MATTYYERNGNLYKLVVDANVLDYIWHDGSWSSANDALTGWIIGGDGDLTPVDEETAAQDFPRSTDLIKSFYQTGPVRKYNENHDDHGRFDFSDGGSSSALATHADKVLSIGGAKITVAESKGDAKTGAQAEQAFKAINEVQGNVGSPTVKVTVDHTVKDGSIQAYYSPKIPGQITLNATPDITTEGVQSGSLVHEYGHMLDYEGLGGADVPLNESDGLKGVHYPGTWVVYGNGQGNDALTPVMNAIGRSDAMAMLEYQVNHNELEYFRNPSEAFARAYSQWVATRSSDTELKAGLKFQQEKLIGQWDSQDFIPIGKEFDKLLGKK